MSVVWHKILDGALRDSQAASRDDPIEQNICWQIPTIWKKKFDVSPRFLMKYIPTYSQA